MVTSRAGFSSLPHWLSSGEHPNRNFPGGIQTYVRLSFGLTCVSPACLPGVWGALGEGAPGVAPTALATLPVGPVPGLAAGPGLAVMRAGDSLFWARPAILSQFAITAAP